MAQPPAGDYSHRCHLQFTQLLLEVGLSPSDFSLELTAMDPPVGPQLIRALVLITHIPKQDSASYSLTRYGSWTAASRKDLAKGRFK